MTVREDAQLVWDYLCRGWPPQAPVDALIAFGSHDPRVAQHAADLMLRGAAPIAVMTGGRGKDTPAAWRDSEGAHYARLLEGQGVSPARILVEPRATNTGENITLSRALLGEHGLVVQSVLLVTKPYMQRRAHATAEIRWPEASLYTSAAESSLDEYISGGYVDCTDFLNLMVGDLQRMRVYADRGHQAPHPVPEPVWDAYERLVNAGYDRYVLR